MRIGILGPLEVRGSGGRELPIAGARLRALLTRLAVQAGRSVSSAALLDAIWGERPPAEAANALQTLVSRLRRALGDPAAVRQDSAGYRLAIAAEDVDALRFERLAGRGAQLLAAGEPDQAAVVLDEALALWRGEALSDAGPDAEVDRARLAARRLDATADRIEADLRRGRSAQLAAELDALVLVHPLDERLAALQLRALAARGRGGDALRGYARLRATLREELGVEPSPPLQRLHLALLRGESPDAHPPVGPGESAPPAARDVPRSNLRAQLTSFVGRELEVARIVKSLDEGRLVTLVGPGGAGKTRLAIESTSGLEADPVWFVELASVSEPADVPQAVLGSLGMREVLLLERAQELRAPDAMSRLIDGLAASSAVIVLDNCEHLVDAAARLADTLLGRCPRLRVLATSREPLGIFGETLLVVPPLGQPAPHATPADALEYPAVRLFVDRAAAVRPDFTVDAASVATVIEIVRRLDGLPLAIELAAARLRHLPLAEIANRLSDRFRLLTGGSRTALPRHRTLRAVVDWSWELLTEAERTLAERLSVFGAGVTVESATAVCSGGVVEAAEIADLLAALVDRSLLQPVGDGGRLRMLETIREFGSEKITAAGELTALRAAHAEYFANLLEAAQPYLRTSAQLPWLTLLRQERDNILAAMRFRGDTGDADGAVQIAVGLGGLAMMLGNHGEASSWLAETLAVPGGHDRDLRSFAVALHSMTSATMFHPDEDDPATAAKVRERIEVLDELGSVDAERFPMVHLLRPAMALFADEPGYYQRYLAEAKAAADPWVVTAAHMVQAGMAENDGDLDAMRLAAAEALRRARALGERWVISTSLHLTAMVCTLDGDLAGAQAAYEESLTLIAELGSHDDEAMLRARLADIAVRRGDFDRARELIAVRGQQAWSGLDAVFLSITAAEVERHAGDLAAGQRLMDDAAVRVAALARDSLTGQHAVALVAATRAALLSQAGQRAEAEREVRAAYAAATRTRDQPVIAGVGVVVAQLAADRGEAGRAAELLGAAACIRGTEDATDASISALTAALRAALGEQDFATSYQRGRAMARAEALAALDPGHG